MTNVKDMEHFIYRTGKHFIMKLIYNLMKLYFSYWSYCKTCQCFCLLICTRDMFKITIHLQCCCLCCSFITIRQIGYHGNKRYLHTKGNGIVANNIKHESHFE